MKRNGNYCTRGRIFRPCVIRPVRLLSPLLLVSSLSCFGQLVLQQPVTITSESAYYEAPTSITTSADFIVQDSASVTFTAGNTIQLGPGFQATGGTAATTFHALINPGAQTAPITVSSSGTEGGSGSGSGSGGNNITGTWYQSSTFCRYVAAHPNWNVCVRNSQFLSWW